MKKRILSTIVALSLCLTLLPLGALAEGTEPDTGLCPHHTAHTAECGYTEGQFCDYICKLCDVQSLIDALPDADKITKETAADVKTQLKEIDEAKQDLTDEEADALDTARYGAAVAALDALEGQPASAPAPAADQIPMANTAGWNEDHTVYTVIGQEGYPSGGYYGNPISLADGAILDLRRAESFTNTTGYAKVYLFEAQGDLTILGNGNVINFNKKCIVRMPEGKSTLKLKNLYWTETFTTNGPQGIYGELIRENNDLTVLYEGKTALPLMKVYDSGGTLTLQPADANATLNMGGTHYSNSSGNFSIVFDGGTVTVEHYIDATHITIKNNCKLTGKGENFSGIHFITAAGSIIIKDSEVDLECHKVYNTTQKYPALGGQGFDYTKLAEDRSAIRSKIEIDNSKVTVNTDDAHWTTYTISYGGIGWAKDITIKDSDVTVSAMNKNNGGGIGEYFQNITITNSDVVSQAYCYAGIGSEFSPSGWSKEKLDQIKGSIAITDSTVEASSVQGAGIGGAYDSSSSSPQPIDVVISGKSTVTARSVNGAGIGGGCAYQAIKDPDAVIIAPDIGGGWGDGGSGGSLETFSLRSLSADVPSIGDSVIPTAVQKYVASEGQTLTVRSTEKGTPTILAESGVCAISSETVTTDVTIVQNTVETAPSQTIPIFVGGVKLGDLREDFKSIARTAPAGSAGVTNWNEIEPGTYPMTYGNGSDPDPLINNNDKDTKYQAGPYEIKPSQINRFWTIPQQKLGGTAQVAKSSTTGTTVSTSTTNTTLYAKITNLTPADVRSTTVAKRDTLNYQWYKDGEPIENAIDSYYYPRTEGLYWYVVTGSNRYRGSVTSTVVTVTADAAALPTAPTMQSSDKTSITLKQVEGYQYGILQNGEIKWQDSNVFEGLAPNTSYNFFQRVKVDDGADLKPTSPASAFTTKGEKPTEADISYDYEKELIQFNSDIEVFTNSRCSSSAKLSTNAVITDYIGKTLYARYADVSGTGNDVVLAFTVRARPSAPVLYPEDIQAATDSITVTGTPGVAYNYAKPGETPDKDTALVCQDGTVTFTGLAADTAYTIYARWPASNEEQRFHSDEATISGKTLATDPTSTKIYVPAGATGERTYDLFDVLGNKTINSIDSNALSASAKGTSVTITPTGSETGTVTLAATLSDGTGYTIEVVFQAGVVGEDDNILWLWRRANVDLNTAAQALLPSGESLGTGTTRRLTAVYASGSSAGKTVPDLGAAAGVLLPYWEETGANNDWLIVYQGVSGVERVTSLTLTEGGIQLTGAKPGVYGLYTVKPATQKNFGFAITEKSVTTGDGSFTEAATGAAIGSTVTYSSSNEDVAKVDPSTGAVTIVGAGEAIITATASAVENKWKETTATYTLTVTQKTSGGSSTHTVTVADADHGTLQADRTRAARGATVTITVTPNGGYKLDQLTVTDAKGNELPLTDKGGGKYTFQMPASKVTVTATFTESSTEHICPSLAFSDLSTTAWYHEAVDNALTSGMMNGYGGGRFGPNDSLSRAQLCQILHNLEGQPAAGQSAFEDVADSAWYAKAVTWANANGIVVGYGHDLFGPDDPITREQLATILWRYANYKGYGLTQGGMAIHEFSDYQSTSAYAMDAMTWAVDAGVLSGFEDQTLRPQNGATRAETAQMLMNFMNAIG